MLYRLAAVENRTQLAKALGVPIRIFRSVVNSKNAQELYFRHEIPKKNPRFAGEVRIAWEAEHEMLARSHKATARRLDAYLRSKDIGYPHPCVHGYVHGGSTRSNATPHCGAKFLVRADIEGFFPSISRQRIAASLRSLGMRTEPARDLAKFVTINDALPLGLPESPILSNLIALDLDTELAKFARKRGLNYTRYSDDITFSGCSQLPTKDELREIFSRHDFLLSERKFRSSKRGQAHFVTGLSVSERDYPHVPKKIKRKLRQELYYCHKYGLDAHAKWRNERPLKTFNRLYGLVQYVSFIESQHAKALRSKWKEVADGSFKESVFQPTNSKIAKNICLIVDESEFEVGKDRFLALSVARTEDLAAVRRGIQAIKADYIATPGAKGNLDKLENSGIHFTDAHYDLRTLAFQSLLELPWSASILFKRIDRGTGYAKTWLGLFRRAFRQELSVADGALLSVLVEQNDKISTSRLVKVTSSEFVRATDRGSRRPLENPMLQRISKKNSPEVTLPDFVLAAFRHNAIRSDERLLDFERIRDRVRYIHDVDLNVFYTRKRSFVDIGVSPVEAKQQSKCAE